MNKSVIPKVKAYQTQCELLSTIKCKLFATFLDSKIVNISGKYKCFALCYCHLYTDNRSLRLHLKKHQKQLSETHWHHQVY